MEYRILPHGGERISVLGMGSSVIGAKPSGRRSRKKALRGFLIALAVNACVAVILAVLRAVL